MEIGLFQLWLEEKQFLRKLAQSTREGSVNTSIDNLIYIHSKPLIKTACTRRKQIGMLLVLYTVTTFSVFSPKVAPSHPMATHARLNPSQQSNNTEVTT